MFLKNFKLIILNVFGTEKYFWILIMCLNLWNIVKIFMGFYWIWLEGDNKNGITPLKVRDSIPFRPYFEVGKGYMISTYVVKIWAMLIQ